MKKVLGLILLACLTEIVSFAQYQPLENQRLSMGDSVKFSLLRSGQARIGQFDSTTSFKPVITTTGSNVFAPAVHAFPNYSRTGGASAINPMATPTAVAGVYTGVSPTGGSGSGMIITAMVGADLFTSFEVTTGGTGYKPGDAVTVNRSTLGSTAGGTFTLIVGNVVSGNTFSLDNAPVTADNYVQQSGFSGAFTPLFSGRTFDRNGTQSGPKVNMGIYYGAPNTSYFGILVNNTYSAGFQAGILNTPTLSTNMVQSNTINSGGPVTCLGNVFTGQAYEQTVNAYLSSSSYRSTVTVIPGVVGTLSINNTGAGYTPGSYKGIVAIGGTGSGLRLDIEVNTSGIITSVVRSIVIPTYHGTGYTAGDVVTAVIPGGSGFSATIATLRPGQLFPMFYNNSTFRGNTGDQLISFYSSPVVNQPAGSTGDIYGFYHNPILTSLRGKNIAFQNTTGDVYMSTTSGNVGIGTTKPTEKFSVNGTILAKRVKVATTAENWPDYVFGESYQLTPLSQVEAYIQKNQHLPEVPSAKEVNKNGLDLAANQVILLKKIEELTLYIIEQEKRIKILEERNGK